MLGERLRWISSIAAHCKGAAVERALARQANKIASRA
jgi:hypothetical protein